MEQQESMFVVRQKKKDSRWGRCNWSKIRRRLTHNEVKSLSRSYLNKIVIPAKAGIHGASD